MVKEVSAMCCQKIDKVFRSLTTQPFRIGLSHAAGLINYQQDVEGLINLGDLSLNRSRIADRTPQEDKESKENPGNYSHFGFPKNLE